MSPRHDRWCLFVLALLAYLATAAPGAWWLDSAELTAAGASLGIPHAPGHPLYVVLAYGFSWIPVGSVAFRVALLSALCGAASVVLVYECARLVAAAAGQASASLPARGAAALAALAVGCGYALWHHSVRAEVYTLHLVLALLALRLALLFAIPREAPPTQGPVLCAALLMGLGLANHHYLVAFHVPLLAALFLATREGRKVALGALPWAVVLGLAPLGLYALLPLRAAQDPLLDYGDPRTWGRLWAVFTASPFQASLTEVSQPLHDRLDGALEITIRGVGPVWLCAAPWGLLLLARARSPLAWALALGLAAALAGKLLMHVDPGVPDHHAYLLPALALVAILGAAALARAVASPRLPWRTLGLGSLGAAGVLGWLGTANELAGMNLAGSRSAAVLDAMTLSEVRPDAVLMPHHYETTFNRAYHQIVEGARPDVVMVHQGMDRLIEGGRPFADRLERRDPRLAPMLEGFVASGGDFPQAEILALAAQRPVYLEATFAPPLPADRLAYAGGVFRVVAPGAGDGASAQRTDAAWLAQTLIPELGRDPEALETVAGWWLAIAVVRLRQGLPRAALEAIDLTLALAPGLTAPLRLRPLGQHLAAVEASGDRRAFRAAIDALRREDLGALLEGPTPFAAGPQ